MSGRKGIYTGYCWVKLGIYRFRGNCSFEMGFEGIHCDDADQVDLAQTRNRQVDVGNTVIKLWIP